MTTTNAMRLLRAAGIPFVAHTYPTDDGLIDAICVAHKLAQDPAIIFKTLVTSSESNELFVFIIPGHLELDLKAAAKACGQKRVQMLPVKHLLAKTGYVHGGCSPIGMKHKLPTYIDESALSLDTIFVSAGKIGVNLSIAPRALASFIDAQFAPLTKAPAL